MHYESSTETAKKIRAALRRAFPGQPFSVRSSADSVSVSWEDGPLVPDVEDVLHAFQSYETRRSSGEDRREAVGYSWEGRRIVGAQYLRTSRRLSAARRAHVAERLAEQGVSMQDATKPLLLAAEREIINQQTHSVLEQMEAWEAAWSEYMHRLRRLEDLEAQGRYGYQLRMPRAALGQAIQRLRALDPDFCHRLHI